MPLTVGERHDCVVERSLDVGLPHRDVLANAAAPALWSTRGWTHFLPAFFLPATCMRFGPLRVRALVLVFWPRTGRARGGGGAPGGGGSRGGVVSPARPRGRAPPP